MKSERKTVEKFKSKKDSGIITFLKRSFGNKKNGDKNKIINEEVNKQDINYIENVCNNNFYQLDNGLNYSFDFLDAFSSNTSDFINSNQVRNKIKSYTSSYVNNKNDRYSLSLNKYSVQISENPKFMESVILVVVDDYINMSCDNHLKTKMKCVMRKVQNISRNNFTKPGLKKCETLKLAGNVTQVDNEGDKNNYTGKTLNNIYHYERKVLLNNCILKKDNIKCLGLNFAGNKITKIKSFSTLQNKLKSEKNHDKSIDHSQSNSSNVSKNISLPLTQPTKEVNRPKNETCVSKKFRSKSNQFYFKSLENPNKQFSRSALSNVSSKIDCNGDSQKLKIVKVVEIDIKPLREKFVGISKNISSNCYERRDIKLEMKNKLNNFYTENLKTSKMRRSVTFMEPRHTKFNSSLKINHGYLSEMEINTMNLENKLKESRVIDKSKVKEIAQVKDHSSEEDLLVHFTNCANDNSNFMFVSNKMLGKSVIQNVNHANLSPTIISIRSSNSRENLQYSLNEDYSELDTRNSMQNCNESDGCIKSYFVESQINLSTASTSETMVHDEYKSETNTQNFSVIEIINRLDNDHKLTERLGNYNNLKDNSCASLMSTCMESYIHSSKSSLNDADEEIIIAEYCQTLPVEQKHSEIQEILVSEENIIDDIEEIINKSNLTPKYDSNVETFKNSQLYTPESSSLHNENSKPILKKSYNNRNLNLDKCHLSTNDISPINFSFNINSKKNTISVDANKNRNWQNNRRITNNDVLFERHLSEKSEFKPACSVFRHTVASKQKIRDKVRFRETCDNNNISKIPQLNVNIPRKYYKKL